jgi:hypothetical protein
MSLSVPNTGATAVEASRYAVITQDRLETSWKLAPDGRQRRGDDGLVEQFREIPRAGHCFNLCCYLSLCV